MIIIYVTKMSLSQVLNSYDDLPRVLKKTPIASCLRIIVVPKVEGLGSLFFCNCLKHERFGRTHYRYKTLSRELVTLSKKK